ncbi:MAG: hypothetical protein AAF560_06730 [Acidobacteriota bacterium]
MATSSAKLSHPSDLDLLYPLTEFFDPGEPLPLVREEVGDSRMPEPHRSLLVHDSDMTSTLESFHSEPLWLRTLEKRRQGTDLLRKVVLFGEHSGRPHELGAIRIDLAAFSTEARWVILEGNLPLGSILARFKVPYTSSPRLFFRLDSDARFEHQLELKASATLYGRQNVLSSPSGRPLAEVVEILPPVRE